jgi:D-glycero-alpha-D-manno-heptose-7-phosphate kinase
MDLSNKNLQYLGSNLLLFYTGKTRQSSEILAEQKSNTSNGINTEYLNKIKELAIIGYDSFLKGKFDKVGKLIKKNWEFKKMLSSKISNGEISGMCEKAIKSGALGAKISGAGGGGFLLVYCESEKQNKLKMALKDYREMPFLLEQHGSKIIFNYMSYSWK